MWFNTLTSKMLAPYVRPATRCQNIAMIDLVCMEGSVSKVGTGTFATVSKPAFPEPLAAMVSIVFFFRAVDFCSAVQVTGNILKTNLYISMIGFFFPIGTREGAVNMVVFPMLQVIIILQGFALMYRQVVSLRMRFF